MTRPRRQTVDWFPHACSHGKTIFVLEKKYGIAGYGFWFKLLEILGNTPGHFIDTSDVPAYEYLQAYTYTDEETCQKILDLLAGLDAIDPRLWRERKTVWCDNFVQGIAEAYRKRAAEMPIKPSIPGGNYTKVGQSAGETRKLSVEERERGEEKRKEKKKIIAEPGLRPATAFFTSAYFEVLPDYREKLFKEYPLLSDDLLRREFSRMEDWLDDNKKNKKFKANGRLANEKLFIRNWLDRLTLETTGRRKKGPEDVMGKSKYDALTEHGD